MFNADKLLENAVTSIRLGVEDFKSSQAPGGDRGRHLSAARNLFAGLLLLFKYRIVGKAKNEQEGAKLIFKASEPQPGLLADGSVTWEPARYKTTTIDFGEIQHRFKQLGITADWTALHELHAERNNIEHLYPIGGGAVARFVADAFPVLKDFIIDELDREPTALLGEAWQTMLTHQAFFEHELALCEKAWDDSMLPGGMWNLANAALCGACGSSLIKPLSAGAEPINWDGGHHLYICVACGQQGDAVELLTNTLAELESSGGRLDFRNPPTAVCLECDHATYAYEHGECVWCGYQPKYLECSACGNRLSLDEQGLGGECRDHHHVVSKND